MTAPSSTSRTLSTPSDASVVETAGAEPIPLDRRHGSPHQLLWTWASPQVGFATVFIGILSVTAFGLSFWQAAAALVLGAALGSAAHAALSTDGPRFGVPQMVVGRLAFGRRGAALPAAGNALVTGIGWFAVNSLGGAFALSSLTGLAPFACLLIVVTLEIVIGYVGHDLVHRFEQYAFPVLAVVFALAGIWIFKGAALSAPSDGGGVGGFLLAFSACFGFTAGWNPSASDYSRYLPPSTPVWKTALYPALGLFLSISAVALIGAASGTVAAPDGVSPTDAFTGQLPGWLSSLTLLAIVLGAMAAGTLNVYSAAVSLSSLALKLPKWLGRAGLAVLTGAAGTAAAAASISDAGHAFESFLLVIAYWIAPWLGVVLTEQALRRGTSDAELAARLADPAYRDRAGVIALLVGIAVSVPVFSNQQTYVGWAPAAWPAIGDLTCPVGLVLSAAVYAVLRQRTNKK
ncbi:purine-cytosine permease family protein [Streptomyces sp. NBC_01304]|uniref:purine-cytosine permease family protein n=1 Tax=Streptomyces sp. NBC_01304 TaxID=2903818 RepID=UPI002E14DEE7|nr:cytosine permease [Streptomyces sp. NBC_01304]